MPTPEPTSAPAPAAIPGPGEIDALRADVRAALASLVTLDPGERERISATLDELLSRARPSARDVKMLRGICRQLNWLTGRRAGRVGSRREPDR